MKPIVVIAVVASLKIFADEACHSAAALELAIADAANGFEILSSVQVKCSFLLSQLLSRVFSSNSLSLNSLI